MQERRAFLAAFPRRGVELPLEKACEVIDVKKATLIRYLLDIQAGTQQGLCQFLPPEIDKAGDAYANFLFELMGEIAGINMAKTTASTGYAAPTTRRPNTCWKPATAWGFWF
jgi:hypothetical protein